MSALKKTLGIGAVVGLIIGLLLGVALIRIANVPYLETRFAFGRLVLGLVIGVVLGTLGAYLLGDRVEGMTLGRVKALIAVGVLTNFAETVISIRRIIP